MLDELQQAVFWPGDTLIAWLVTTYPRLALRLGLSPDSTGGLVAALISVLAGWSLYITMGHLTLLGVQLWEARRRRPQRGELPTGDEGEE